MFGLTAGPPVWNTVTPVVRLATGVTRAATMKITSTATMMVPKMLAFIILEPTEGIEMGLRERELPYPLCRLALYLPIVHIVVHSRHRSSIYHVLSVAIIFFHEHPCNILRDDTCSQ
jgi:hypothetical protein